MRGYDIAATMIGLHETKNNKEIAEFLKKHSVGGDIAIDPSATAWCAAFINACERAAGHKGTGRLNARSFLEYGKEIKNKDAEEGDILIFTRGNSSWQGHVTYFDEFTQDSEGHVIIKALGGNQQDSVCYSYYGLKDLLGIRRP